MSFSPAPREWIFIVWQPSWEQSSRQTKCVLSILTEDLRLSWVKDVASCLSICLSLLSVVCVYPVMMRLTCCVC